MEWEARVLYTDGTEGTLPLIREETEKGFRVRLEKKKIEKAAEGVDFPSFAPAKAGEDGYIIYNNDMITFREREDQKLETGYCQMPFFGVRTPRACFACIVTGLWEQHSFVIEVKDGVYTAHPRFILEGQEVEADMEAEYVLLSGKDADYSGMARAYREYRIKRDGMKPLRERAKENPYLAYLLDAPDVRVRLAWKPVPTPVEEQTEETEPPMRIAATFDQVGQMMEACRAAGVDKAQFCLVGWNKSGHDGRWPQAFPVEEKLGGEAGLRKLIQKAEELGYHIVCHTNATDCYSISNRWSEDLPIRTRDGEKQTKAQYSGGRMYNMCPAAGGEAYMMEDLPKIRDLGFHGIHYIDVISCVPPRRCFSPKHPMSQRQFIASMRRIAKRSAELMGGFQSEGGYDYLADISDRYLYVDFHLFNGTKAMSDRNVPMWQMVYHGFTLTNPAPATVNYPIKDWKRHLKFIEYGGHPAIYLYSLFLSTGKSSMGTEQLTCGTKEETEATAKAIRKALDEYRAMEDLQLETMVHHAQEGDLAVTEYESGAKVVCNWGETEQTYAGVRIAPHEYAVIRN